MAIYDDLRCDPAQFIRSVCAFLGVDEAFQPAATHRKVNPAGRPRSAAAGRSAFRVIRLLRGMGLFRVIHAARGSEAVRRLLLAGDCNETSPEMPVEIRRWLQDTHAGQIRSLSSLLDRDPSHRQGERD